MLLMIPSVFGLFQLGHVIQCIGSLKGQAQCPDCGQMIKGKDFKEHMDKNQPIKDVQQD